MAEGVAKLKRLELDVTDLIKEVLGNPAKLVKDLHEDEVICGRCGGLGFAKWETPFRTEGDPDFGFPHTKEAFTQCPSCYTGVQTLCKLCSKALPKGRLVCDCDAARAVEREARDAKEAERRKHLTRIPYHEYKGECIYDDDAECFIYDGDDSDLDHTHTYFACKASKDWVHVDKDDVLDRIKERASEEVEEGDDMVDWAPEAEAKLEALLEAWFKENVEVRDAFWPDRSTIVVVSPADCGIVWDEDDDELEEAEARENLVQCSDCHLLLDKRKYEGKDLTCKKCRGVTACSGGCGKEVVTAAYAKEGQSFVYVCTECQAKAVDEREKLTGGST